MADARSRRDHPQVAELALGPTQQRVALAVALHLLFHVEAAGFGHPGVVHLHGVVDHQVDRDARVDDRRVSPGPRHRGAEGREVHHAGHAREVLQQHPRRHEGELRALGRGGVPVEQGQHVLLLHDALSAVAQAVLEQHPDGVRQPGEVAPGGRGQLAQTGHPGSPPGQVDGLPGPERAAGAAGRPSSHTHGQPSSLMVTHLHRSATGDHSYR